MERNRSILRRIDETGVAPLVMRLLLGGMFIWMGYQKIGHPIEFLKQVHLYHMLPQEPAVFLNGTAIVLPWLEVVCGVALVAGIFVRGAVALIAIMLVVFTPAIFLRAMAVHTADGTAFFDIKFDCGCGAGEVLVWQKLLENTGLWLAALLLLFSRSRRFCLELWLSRRSLESPYCASCGYTLRDPSRPRCDTCEAASPAEQGPSTNVAT